MLHLLKRYLDAALASAAGRPEEGPEPALAAAAALLLAVAESDRHLAPEEDRLIRLILKRDLGVTDNEVEPLLEEARSAYDKQIDFFEFTSLLNQKYPREEKLKILRLLWQVVFADGILEEHEDHLMHRLAELLNLSHKELIEAKLEARRTCFRAP